MQAKSSSAESILTPMGSSSRDGADARDVERRSTSVDEAASYRCSNFVVSIGG